MGDRMRMKQTVILIMLSDGCGLRMRMDQPVTMAIVMALLIADHEKNICMMLGNNVKQKL